MEYNLLWSLYEHAQVSVPPPPHTHTDVRDKKDPSDEVLIGMRPDIYRMLMAPEKAF